MRELLSSQQELLQKVTEPEDRMEDQDEKITTIFECMKELLREAIVDRPAIGFKQETKPRKPS